MSQSRRTLQEHRTPLDAAEVLSRAKTYFARRHGIYSTFLEQEGPSFVTFRGQGGEEIVIAAVADAGSTRVTGSTYLFDMQVARFFTLLPSVEGASVPVDMAPVPEGAA